MLLANVKAGIAQKERALLSLGNKYNIYDDAKPCEKIERQNHYSAYKPIKNEIKKEEENSGAIL